MPNTKITDLTDLTAAAGDEIPVNRAGSDGKVTAEEVANTATSTPNLVTIQSRTVTLADAGADAFLGWDDSQSAYENLTATEALEIIKTVDGSGSGLDADLLDGNNIGTSGAAVPLLSTANTWGADQSVPDEAYGVAWNGSLEVPTKNAVYDKIETIASRIVLTTDTTYYVRANLGTVTFDTGNDLVNLTSHGLSADDRVVFYIPEVRAAGSLRDLRLSPPLAGLDFGNNGCPLHSAQDNGYPLFVSTVFCYRYSVQCAA